MADITMCRGENCEVKDACYRYTATANEYRQAYFMNTPVFIDGVTCDEFWSNHGRQNDAGSNEAV